MKKWPYSFNKETRETYLKYKWGEIVEEEKTRRKELHEDETFIPILQQGEKETTIQYMEDSQATRHKLEQPLLPGLKRWQRGFLSFLSLLLILASLSFMGRYTLSLLEQPLPERTNQTEWLTGLPSFLQDWVAKSDGLFQNAKQNFLPKKSLFVSAEPPRLKYDTKAQEQLLLASDIHGQIMHLYEDAGYEAARYDDRKITLVTLTARLNAIQLKTDTLQLTLGERVGKDHPLYPILKERVDALSMAIQLLNEAKRSQVLTVINERIRLENGQSETFVSEMTKLLDQYRIPYTLEDGNLLY